MDSKTLFCDLPLNTAADVPSGKGRSAAGRTNQITATVLILLRAVFTAGMLMMIMVMMPSAGMKEKL